MTRSGERRPASVRVGSAGWSIPHAQSSRFPGGGTHLERYARLLAATEIDSTFYRSHRPETYERWAAGGFFGLLRQPFEGQVVCEPRHRSWFADEAARMLADARVGRVAADPARVPEATEPGGWTGVRYWRLHGSPRTYYSAYSPRFIQDLARKVVAGHAPAWCIFDNTVGGAATRNALDLLRALARPQPRPAE